MCELSSLAFSLYIFKFIVDELLARIKGRWHHQKSIRSPHSQTRKTSQVIRTRHPRTHSNCQSYLHGATDVVGSKRTSKGLWRRSWTILWHAETLRVWRLSSWIQLFVPGWLRWSRATGNRSNLSVVCAQNKIPGKSEHSQRKSRIRFHHSNLWFLRIM